MLGAGGFERRVEIARVGFVGIDRRQIRAAAEPALRRDEMPRIHMHSGHERRARMDDKRDAACPEARILLGTRDLAAEFRAELARDGRDIDAGLLEDAAFEDRHRAAAAALALPVLALKTVAGARIELVLDRLERGADAIAQRLEPRFRLGLLSLVADHEAPSGHCPVWRNASPNTTAAASATLSERKPGRTGIATRAAAA